MDGRPDEAGADRRVKTEEEYRKLLANINNVITNQAQSATGDRIALRDAVCAYLEVEQANTAAVNLYETLGFRSLGSLTDYYGEGRNGLHMVCDVPVQPTLFEAVA